MKIALIPPINKSDYLVNTVIDGLLWLKRDGVFIELKIPDYEYPCPYDISSHKISEAEFISFATEADLIMLGWGKTATNHELANKINRWSKTIFIDGSELGKNRRYDEKIGGHVKAMTYAGIGAIDKDMLRKSAAYFRRERPYISGIIPLPFGIESRYVVASNQAQAAQSSNEVSPKKNIDFVCIFGQEDYPALRKEVRLALEEFCKKNGFTCMTKKTKGFSFDDDRKLAGRDQFYEALYLAKVGVSVGGGGYDTARFWEILGNNCILLTEKIAIYKPDSKAFDYKRVWQFKDLDELKMQLEKLGTYLRNDYEGENDQKLRAEEYKKILTEHSTKARVITVLRECEKKGVIEPGQIKSLGGGMQ